MKLFQDLLLIFFIGGILIGCSKKSESYSVSQLKIANSYYQLTQKQISELMDSAKLDSGEAAFKLANYYEFIKNDFDESRRWLMISAERGLAKGQYNLGWEFANHSASPDDSQKAIYWLNLASKQGYKKADTLLLSLTMQK